MITELAMNEWTVTSDTISKRVDRYETKAKWKHVYKKRVVEQSTENEDEPFHQQSSSIGIGVNDGEQSKRISPRAYSVSISHSLTDCLVTSIDEERIPLIQSPTECDPNE
jgi:hypothetical protein